MAMKPFNPKVMDFRFTLSLIYTELLPFFFGTLYCHVTEQRLKYVVADFDTIIIVLSWSNMILYSILSQIMQSVADDTKWSGTSNTLDSEGCHM